MSFNVNSCVMIPSEADRPASFKRIKRGISTCGIAPPPCDPVNTLSKWIGKVLIVTFSLRHADEHAGAVRAREIVSTLDDGLHTGRFDDLIRTARTDDLANLGVDILNLRH